MLLYMETDTYEEEGLGHYMLSLPMRKQQITKSNNGGNISTLSL